MIATIRGHCRCWRFRICLVKRSFTVHEDAGTLQKSVLNWNEASGQSEDSVIFHDVLVGLRRLVTRRETVATSEDMSRVWKLLRLKPDLSRLKVERSFDKHCHCQA